jgi:thioredoxin-related protein
MEMKNSEKLKNTFKDNKEVVFLNISIDNSKSKWKETLEKRNVKGINVLSLNGQEESIVEKYQVPAIPRFILVDKDGKIADFTARSPSSNKVESDIRKLL